MCYLLAKSKEVDTLEVSVPVKTRIRTRRVRTKHPWDPCNELERRGIVGVIISNSLIREGLSQRYYQFIPLYMFLEFFHGPRISPRRLLSVLIIVILKEFYTSQGSTKNSRKPLFTVLFHFSKPFKT